MLRIQRLLNMYRYSSIYSTIQTLILYLNEAEAAEEVSALNLELFNQNL